MAQNSEAGMQNKQTELKKNDTESGNIGSMDFLTIALIGGVDSSVRILKSQHTDILSALNQIRDVAMGDSRLKNDTDKSIEIRNQLTTLVACVTMHFSMENNVLFKPMASEQRSRAMASQFERSIGDLKSSFHSFQKKFCSPSTINQNFVEFLESLEKQIRSFSDAFKEEERDIYSSHDKNAR